MGWATDEDWFSTGLWTVKSRAKLDGSDGWKRGWLINGGTVPRLRFMRQQGGRGVMFSARIIGENLVGPFLVLDNLKMNFANYCKFLNDNLLPWLNLKKWYPKKLYHNSYPYRISSADRNWGHFRSLVILCRKTNDIITSAQSQQS